MSTRQLLRWVTLLFVGLLAFGSSAQTMRTWDDGGNNNSWNKDNNWSGNTVPDGTSHIAYFNGGNNVGNKVYVTSEGGGEGTTRNLYALNFFTDEASDDWRIYANKNEVANSAVKVRIHNSMAHNLLGGGSADLYFTLEMAANMTWSMNAGFLVLNEPLSGSGNIVGQSGGGIDGLGGVTLKKAGSYSGTFTSGKGGIDIDHVNALQHAIVNLNDASVNRLVYVNNANIGAISGDGDLTLSGNLNVGAKNSTTTFSGVINGSGSLTKKGSGILTLSGNNTYSGNTTIDAGSIKIGHANALRSSKVFVNTGNGLNPNGVDAVVGGLAGSGVVPLSFGETLHIQGTAGSDYTGAIYGSGNLKVVSGRLTLSGSGAGLWYTGSTQLAGGELGIKSTGQLPFLEKAISMSGGGDLLIDGTTQSLYEISASGDGNSLSLANSGELHLGENNASFTFSGNLAGSGTIRKKGTGTLTLNGAGGISQLNGGFYIDAGKVIAEGTGLPRVVGQFVNNGELELSPSGTFNFSNTAISGPGDLIVKSGLVILPSGDSYSGGTTLMGGRTQVTQPSALGTGPVYLAGGTLLLKGNAIPDSATFSQGLNLVDGADVKVEVQASSHLFTWSELIDHTGGFQKLGSGRLRLINDHTYSGETTITAGILELGAPGAGGSSAGNLSGSQVLNNGTIEIYRNNAALIAPPISGTGNIVKWGSGKATLSGVNTYTGGTEINSGIVEVGNGGTSGTIGQPIINNATLSYNRSDDLQLDPMTGSGNVVVSGGGMLTLFGDHTNLGQATVNNGTLAFAKTDTGAIAVMTNIINNAHVQITKSGNWLNTYDGLISGTGSVEYVGGQQESRFRMDRDQTYTGLTTIDRGTLYLGNLNTEGWIAGDLAVVNSGTVRFNRSDDKTFPGIISGPGRLHKYGAGVLTLTGQNSYLGETKIVEGTLLVHGSLDDTDVTVQSGTTLGGNGSIAGSVTVAGTLTPGASEGTLTVSNDVTITGTYLAEIDGPSNDLLVVTGELDISTGTLDIDLLGGGATEEIYILATYGNLVGTFASVVDLPAGYTLSYAFDDGNSTNNIAIWKPISAPTATAISPAISGPSNATNLDFTVVFDKAVTGFDSFADLSLSTTDTATATGASFSTTDTITYVVTLTEVSGDGTLSLSIATGSNVKDLVGNNLASSVTSSLVALDHTAPSVTITTAESSPSKATSIVYSALFSEPVSGFDDGSDLFITVASVAITDLNVATIVNVGDNIHFTVTLNDIQGDGLLRFRPLFDNVTDEAGNTLLNDQGNFGPALTIDNTEPVLALNGDAALALDFGATWSDPGATTDDGSAVVIGGDTVNTAVPAIYTPTYNATDAAGNIATQLTRTVTVRTAYLSWSLNNGLTEGLNDGLEDNPDGDTWNNRAEYALNGDPLSGTDDGKIAAMLIDADGLANVFAYTFPALDGTVFDGTPARVATNGIVVYTVRGTTNLLTAFDQELLDPGTITNGMSALNSGWSYQTFTFDFYATTNPAPPAAFMKLEIGSSAP